jgi:hypothetical protein
VEQEWMLESPCSGRALRSRGTLIIVPAESPAGPWRAKEAEAGLFQASSADGEA